MRFKNFQRVFPAGLLAAAAATVALVAATTPSSQSADAKSIITYVKRTNAFEQCVSAFVAEGYELKATGISSPPNPAPYFLFQKSDDAWGLVFEGKDFFPRRRFGSARFSMQCLAFEVGD